MINGKIITNKEQYLVIVRELTTFLEKFETLKASRISALAKLLNEAANYIIHYNPEIGSYIKDKANILLNFGDLDNPDALYYFNEGENVLKKGIEDFISTLEVKG
jgi:hypothetical protein